MTDETKPPETTALTVYQPEDTSLEPRTLDQLKAFADTFAMAQLLPSHLRGKPADLAITVMYGRELGLTPVQAIQDIFVIEGKPGVSAGLAIAKVKSSPVCDYFIQVESTDQKATYETHRKGEPQPVRLTFTLEDAKRAELADKKNWKRFPAAMLRNRAAMQLARDVYPDVVRNIYDRDEVEDFRPAAPTYVAPPVMSGNISAFAQVTDESSTIIPTKGEPIIEPPRPKTLAARIESARTVGDLEKLLPDLQALPEAEKAIYRTAYTAKKKALLYPESKPTWGDEVKADGGIIVQKPAVSLEVAGEREPGADDDA